ncbi:MAG: Ger(x)C family spore germination protein [Clostridiaceae bacterium]
MLKKLIICLSIILMLTGCYDKVEIDRKSIVSTLGIDVGDDILKVKELNEVTPESPFAEKELNKLKVTFGFPDMSEIEPQKGTSVKDQFLSADAYSMQDAVTKASLRNSRVVTFGHNKVILFSNELFEYDQTLKEVLDFIERNPDTNKVAYVVVCEGKAEDFIKFTPKNEKNIENYLVGLMESAHRNSAVVPVKFIDLIKAIKEKRDITIPRLTFDKEKKEVIIKGSSIFQDYAIKGFVSSIETADLEVIKGKAIGGKKVIYLNGNPVDLIINGVNSKVTLTSKDVDNLEFNVDILIEGDIASYQAEDDLYSKQTLDNIQYYFNKSLSEEYMRVLNRTQIGFGVDVVGFNSHLKSFHPLIYGKVKDDWIEYFKKANINISVDTKLRRIGVIK